MSLVPVIHLVCTAAMAGLILFVQIVHYPLMARVGGEVSAAYARSHVDRTGFVVGPLMLGEMATALWMVGLPPTPDSAPLAWAGLALLALIWGTTAVFSVPAHRRLVDGFDAPAHRRLVGTNWIRTFGWCARVPIAVALLPGV